MSPKRSAADAMSSASRKPFMWDEDRGGLAMYGKFAPSGDLIQGWGVALSDDGAAKIADEIWRIWIRQPAWHPGYPIEPRAQRNRDNLKGIFDSLASLNLELPLFIEDSRRFLPDLRPNSIDRLLEISTNLEPIFKELVHHGRGRRPDTVNDIIKKLGELVATTFQTEHPQKRLGLKLRTTFVARALTWLDVDRTDGSIEKALSRSKPGHK